MAMWTTKSNDTPGGGLSINATVSPSATAQGGGGGGGRRGIGGSIIVDSSMPLTTDPTAGEDVVFVDKQHQKRVLRDLPIGLRAQLAYESHAGALVGFHCC